MYQFSLTLLIMIIYGCLMIYSFSTDLWLALTIPSGTEPFDIRQQIGERIYAGKFIR